MQITLEFICSVLSSSMEDAEVWAERGYLFVKSGQETYRISIDKERANG